MLTLEITRQLLLLYQQMQLAAETADWDLLATQERSVAALCKAAEASGSNADYPAEELTELHSLITEILQLDQAIRMHAEPALESTRKLLAKSVKGRSMHQAYSG